MNFKNIASYFKFTNQQRKGIFLFLLLIIGLQFAYFFRILAKLKKTFQKRKNGWLCKQKLIH